MSPGWRLALAGGGTGGHVVPGRHLLANLERLAEQDPLRPESALMFGSGRAVEERVHAAFEGGRLPLARVTLRLEPPGGGAPSLARIALRLLPETLRARRALRSHGSDVLLGLGGFTCLPAVLAARSLGLPVVLLEINAAAGRATRALQPLASRVVHAWSATLPARPGERHVVLGPPLAPAFTGPPEDSATARVALGFAPERPLLVVLGGSQGAGGLNTFLADHGAELVAGGLSILHQTGPGRLDEAEGAAAGEEGAYRAVEYVDDVPRALAAATLVLCRGGASTLAEVAALSRPAVVVPYPHHADRHQERNARSLGAGAVLVPESELGATTVARLVELAGPTGASARERMRAALVDALPRDGARSLGRMLFELASATQKSAQASSARSKSVE